MSVASMKPRLDCWTKGGIVTLVAVCALAFSSKPVAADPVGICADNFVLMPAASVQSGAQKDKNGNGLVCAKFSDGKIVGGPDDDTIV